MVTNNRSVTGTSGDAGTSQVQTEIPIAESSQAGTLRLRATSANQNHVQWADDVVDNEGMGKKSSKVCCIYHKPHPVDESSDESSDSSSDYSDDAKSKKDDDQSSKNAGGRDHCNENGESHHCHAKKGKQNAKDRSEKATQSKKSSSNAYEKVPTYNKK